MYKGLSIVNTVQQYSTVLYSGTGQSVATAVNHGDLTCSDTLELLHKWFQELGEDQVTNIKTDILVRQMWFGANELL